MDKTITELLYEKAACLQWLLQQQRMRIHADAGPMADPTHGQGRIIAILKMQDGISTKELSYLLGIRVSSLNELLAKMERNGYIKREPSEADRRVMLIKLTEKGKSERQHEWSPGDVFDCLSEEEQKTLEGYLDRMNAALTESIGVDAEENGRHPWTHGDQGRKGDERFERFYAMMHGGFARGGFGGFHPGSSETPPPPPGRPDRPRDPEED